MKKKKIILGVSGGIAAYKVCDLASLMAKAGYEVNAVLTESASQFVSPLTFKTITGKPVHSNQFHYEDIEPLHIKLVENSELLVLAPATANLIAKIANGIADDLLSTIISAYKGKILLAPAMNTQMWENPFTQINIKKIKENLDCCLIEPEYGELACKTIGIGKLAQIDHIFSEVQRILSAVEGIELNSKLKGMKVLITAGGTREPIDPVRFIGNRSSGKMGLALADEAHRLGAQVILITTDKPREDRDYTIIEVETAHQLQSEVEQYFDTSQILIMSAAVSDFKPMQFYKSKVKKSTTEPDWKLSLTKSPDILETLGRLKKPGQLLVGFAAESDNLLENASRKLENKKLDLIIANEVRPEISFGSDFNEVYLLTEENKQNPLFLPKDTKVKIAEQILDFIAKKWA